MAIFPPLNCFCNVVKNQLDIFLWFYFWALYSVALIHVSMPSGNSFYRYSGYIINLEIRYTTSSHLIFLIQHCFSCSRYLPVINFGTILCIFIKILLGWQILTNFCFRIFLGLEKNVKLLQRFPYTTHPVSLINSILQ